MEFLRNIAANKYVQSVFIFVGIVGGYVTYKSLTYDPPILPAPSAAPQATTDTGSTEAEVADPYAGLHIMSDGTVMLGSGEVLQDAIILEDGTVDVGSGTVVTPKFDLRK